MLQSSKCIALKFWAHPVGTSPLPPWTFDCTCCIVHSLDGSAYLLPVRGKGQRSEVNRFHEEKKIFQGHTALGKTDWNRYSLTSVAKQNSQWGVLSFHCTSLIWKEGVCVCVCVLNELSSVKIYRVTVCTGHYPYYLTLTHKNTLSDLRMLPGQENNTSIKTFTISHIHMLAWHTH